MLKLKKRRYMEVLILGRFKPFKGVKSGNIEIYLNLVGEGLKGFIRV